MSPGQGYGEVSGYEASVVLNRKDFRIDLDLPMETGGAVVGDKVTITLNMESVKQTCPGDYAARHCALAGVMVQPTRPVRLVDKLVGIPRSRVNRTRSAAVQPGTRR